MAKRLEIKQPRAGSNGKTFWTKLGTAWVADNGNISLVFDALPLPALNDKGVLETRAMLMEPLPDDGTRSAPRGGASQRGSYADDLNDDAPPF